MKISASDWNRFWSKVQVGPGCWEWQASLNINGYGQFMWHGTPRGPHRFMLASWYGRWFRTEECVCHHCDNPLCVRPSHLFLGTQQDNVDDMISKGRQVHNSPGVGEDHPRSRYTSEQVREIRRLRADGVRSADLANRFDTNDAHIRQIVTGRSYANAGGPTKNYRRKTSGADRLEIRRRCAAGERVAALAREYGVSTSTIYALKNYTDEEYYSEN